MSDPASTPLYGRDLWCDGDLDPLMPDVEGEVMAKQAILRRLDTPRGALLDDPDYGTALEDMIGEEIDAAERPRIPARIVAEVVKDELVAAARSVKMVDRTGSGTVGVQVDFEIDVVLTDGRAVSSVVGPDEAGRIVLRGEQ